MRRKQMADARLDDTRICGYVLEADHPLMSRRQSEFVPNSLNAMLSRVHRSRQDMIRPVLEQPREYVLLSIHELAARRQVDAATVSRTILAMGFRSYRDFRRYLHQLSIAHTTALDQMQATIKETSTFSGRVKETLDSATSNVHRVVNSLEIDRLRNLAARFYKAKRILILGGDLAESLVSFLHYLLILLGFDAIAATRAGHITHLMRHSTKRDLIIAISFRRGLRQTMEGLLQGKANGSYAVAITDTSISPLARASDEAFIVPIDTPSFTSYVAPMALLDAILSAVANYRTDRTLAILKEAEKEQRDGIRWYPEL
ncbi:MAG TPA: MurR/RpiR family transcriptional regulator [Acidobacteriaceae bacterium]|nr:MurR/RpiR family transcriptional regulator [Acidobacteriaceae bacterium]